ncbi:hypothetical protein GCM10012275_39840 [Longimycelium tulufanense]|uniref:Uncharacterized protein n=1 Tax=Longimycelium tulufanense TaxID=907463 RepID=A0A8J3CI83_9PSEU|nr:hypothetical protein [Longimycelium tulufanense]GGM65343.1 hypothetical protein GCM10012275_39840 [Longimycelium tulufanense]
MAGTDRGGAVVVDSWFVASLADGDTHRGQRDGEMVRPLCRGRLFWPLAELRIPYDDVQLCKKCVRLFEARTPT